jgi:hypothetical protein
MKISMTNIYLTIIAVSFVCCNSAKQNDTTSIAQPANSRLGTLHNDTISLRESFQQEDTAYNEYLANRLKPIRENFKRINSIAKWTATEKIELDESTEGGEATFYYYNGRLEKIAARNFGETFQQLTEYYLLNGELSFVFEKSYKYNRPIYYDSASMRENNDDQVFNLEKSEIVEDRSYFEKEKLIHLVNNKGRGFPFGNDYLLIEQKRILADFNKLKTAKKPT